MTEVGTDNMTDSSTDVESMEEVETQSIEGVLERVAEQDPEAAKKISHYIEVQQVMHRGPMPSPQDLQAYAKTLENLPDRMMAMAELAQSTKGSHHQKILELKQQEIEVQKLEVLQAADAHKRESIIQGMGMIFAFLTVLVCVLGAFYLALNDHTEVALVIGGTTVVGVVGAFLKNAWNSKK